MSYICSFIGWLYLPRRGAGPWSSRALAAHWTQPGLCVWVCVCRGTLDALPSLGVGELVPARAEPRPPTHFIQPIRWLSYDAMLLLLTLPWTAVGRITNYPWSFASYIPFNFHLHIWKPHCSDRATVITSGPNCCSAGTSTTNVNTTTRKYFVKYTAKLMSEIERERQRETDGHLPPPPQTHTFIVNVALLSAILKLQFHSRATLDTCLSGMEITSRHLGVSLSYSEARVSLRIMLCLLGMEILL